MTLTLNTHAVSLHLIIFRLQAAIVSEKYKVLTFSIPKSVQTNLTLA